MPDQRAFLERLIDQRALPVIGRRVPRSGLWLLAPGGAPVQRIDRNAIRQPFDMTSMCGFLIQISQS